MLATPRFALIGDGRVGRSLANWLESAGWKLVRIGCRGASRDSDRRVQVDRLQTGDLDLLLLAVPDGALAALAASLADRPQAAVAVHTYGGRGAEILAPLRRAGSALGSLHPLRAFTSSEAR